MSPEQVVDMFRDAMYIAILMICILIIPSLCVGLIISIIQAATQINEQTLSFIPRLLVTLISLVIFSPWLLQKITSYFELLVHSINQNIV